MPVRFRAAALLAAAVAVAAPWAVTGPAYADSDVTVMTRNLYLGADVGEALSLIPDMPAAAQSMWEQVAATDFTARVPLLAAEASAARPAVIGIQEATTWECRPTPFSGTTVVYDFTKQFLEATAAAGTPYVLASHEDRVAYNPSFSIPAIPFVTTVHDPATFQPLFGTDDAACGFVIGDALAVRADLAASVIDVGTVEYDASSAIVPLVMDVVRGYTWADIRIGSTPVRFVTTHLESMWKADAVPSSAVQARQLVRDLASTTMPLVVMGDFNSDPRDPRDPQANPGGQPETGAACPAQSGSDPTCSAYWTMREGGFADAGPDAADPDNLTWGASALLAGPDLDRLAAAKAMGSPYGMTDRLDYVWLRNGVTASSASIVGAAWPVAGATWPCTTAAQKENGAAAAAAMGATVPSSGACLPTDHAGVVATLALPASDRVDDSLVDQSGPNLGRLLAVAVLVGLVALVVLGVRRSRRRRRARREAAAPQAADGPSSSGPSSSGPSEPSA